MESTGTPAMRDQRVWPVQECAEVFGQCLEALKKDLAQRGEEGTLVWDKVIVFIIIVNDM